MTQLLTEEDRTRLLENARGRADDPELDPAPVVKLFTPDATAVWLLTDLGRGADLGIPVEGGF